MQIRSLPISLSLLAILIASLPAAAATITFGETFDPADVFLVDSSSAACVGTNLAGVLSDTVTAGPCKSLAYTQTLTGYSNPPNVLQNATLTVYFRDDGNDSAEKFTLTGDLNSYWNKTEIAGSGNSTSFGPLSVFAQVVTDGVLSIFIKSDFSAGPNAGDFYFEKSVLNAEWLTGDDENPVSEDENPLPAPEPATLFLFGSGAIVVGYRIRKAQRS